jgi:hypothetical protein
MRSDEKAVIMLRVTPSEFDVLRESIKNERARNNDIVGNPDLEPAIRLERVAQLDLLLQKLT